MHHITLADEEHTFHHIEDLPSPEVEQYHGVDKHHPLPQ